MKVQLLRHATTIVEFAGKRILVDPVLSPAGVKNPIPTKKNGKGLRNPLVDIPIEKTDLNTLLNSIDAVLITHTHSDHFDDLSGELLPKNKPILCQPEDIQVFKKIGFSNVIPIKDTLEWDGINIIRTRCNHGGIYWRRKMGIGSTQNIVLADKSGAMVVVECSSEKVLVRSPKKDYLIATNHFISEEMEEQHTNPEKNWYHSIDRYNTLQNALSNFGEKELPALYAKEILSGKYGFVCQYSKGLNFDTLWSVVYDLSQLNVYRAEGNPARTKFKEDTRLTWGISKK